jgi:hypothetical protein
MSHTPQDVFLRLIAEGGVDLRRLADQHRGDGARLFEGSRRVESSTGDGSVLDLVFDWYTRSQSPFILAEQLYFEVDCGQIKAIFARANSGFDRSELTVDGIAHIDVDFDRFDPSTWQPCRYAFDQVVLEPSPGQALLCPEGFVPLPSGGCMASVEGSYFAHNCLPRFWQSGEAPGGRASDEDTLVEPSPLDAMGFATILPLKSIHWLFRGRVVHRAERDAGLYRHTPRAGFWHIDDDDWDNCVDPPLLQAL